MFILEKLRVSQFPSTDVSEVPMWHLGLQSYWSLAYIRSQKLVLMSVEKRCSSRIDELASKTEGKQAKSKVFFFHILLFF